MVAFAAGLSLPHWRGKEEMECPDSPRYKACGNSMCVNVMQWIGKRIDAAEKELKNEK